MIMENKMKMKFTFERKFLELYLQCPETQRPDFLIAIIEYGLDMKKPDLHEKAFELFVQAKIELDRSWRLYLNGINQPETHKRGGAPIGNRNACKTIPKQYQNNTNRIPLYNNNNNLFNIEDLVEAPFLEPFQKWIYYKQELNEAFKTRSTIEACYRNLLILSDHDPVKAISIVDQSITNGWKNLYGLDKVNTYNSRASNHSTTNSHFDNDPDKFVNEKTW